MVGHRHWVKSCRFTSDNQFMVSAALDRQILVWSLRSVDTKPKHVISSHADYVLDLALLKMASLRLPPSTIPSSSSNNVTSSSATTKTSTSAPDGTRVRILVDGAPIMAGSDASVESKSRSSSPRPVSASSNAKKSGNASGTGVSGGTAATGDEFDLEGNATNDASTSTARSSLREGSAAGERFVSSSKDRSVRIWNARTARSEHVMANTRGVIAISVACSLDGTLLAIGMLDNSIALHSTDAATGFALMRQFRIHNNGILCVRFITNRTIAIGTATGHMQFIHF